MWAAFAPLIAAVVAGLIAGAALWQKRRADNRAEWWRRAQWGVDASFDPDPGRQAMGLAVLEVLATSKLATKEELKIVEEAWQGPLWEVEAAARPERVQAVPIRADERGKIRAARLRLVTDRRLGKVTPEWVKDLAKEPV